MKNVEITDTASNVTVRVKSLFDSGCTGSCISQRLVDEKGLTTHKYEYPIKAYNTDGTENSNGKITEYVQVRMAIDNHMEIIPLAVTNLG